MIHALPNPQKTVELEYSSKEVALAVFHIPQFTKKYKLFKTNELTKSFTFEASEFLSFGVYIDINVTSKSDTRSDVVIEVKRKIGTFDKQHEVSLAHDHIDEMLKLLTSSITTDEDSRILKYKTELDEQSAKEIANKEKEEEALRKARELKERNPAAYYGRITMAFLFVGAILALVIYLIFKVL